MPKYLLAVHNEDPSGCPSMNPEMQEAMREVMQKVERLEAEMTSEGALLFGGKLTAPDSATVVRVENGDMLTTDGPFVEAKEHLGGFYVIQAADLDGALGWARKVSACVDTPIEVRPFWDGTGA